MVISIRFYPGADVSHAAPDSDRPSVTGLVSSVDEHFCRYVATCNVQTAREEIITDLPAMVEVLFLPNCYLCCSLQVLQNAVLKFQKFWLMVRNRTALPSRIIFYR